MTVAYCPKGHEYLVGDGVCHKCRIDELERDADELRGQGFESLQESLRDWWNAANVQGVAEIVHTFCAG